MDAFSRVKQLHNDSMTAWSAFEKSNQAAAEIRKAVSERMEAEEKQVTARIAVLKAEQADSGRSETLRRVGALELEELRKRKINATAAETEAFMQEVENAEQALKDLKEIRNNLRSALDEAAAALHGIRTEVLGNQSIDLAPRWIRGEQDKFSRLCGENHETQ